MVFFILMYTEFTWVSYSGYFGKVVSAMTIVKNKF